MHRLYANTEPFYIRDLSIHLVGDGGCPGSNPTQAEGHLYSVSWSEVVGVAQGWGVAG